MRFNWAAVFSGLDSVPLTPSTRLGMWSAIVLQSPISSSCEALLVLWCPAPWAAAMHCVAVLAAAYQQYSQTQHIYYGVRHLEQQRCTALLCWLRAWLLPTNSTNTTHIFSDKFIHCPTFSTKGFTSLTSSLVISFLRSAGVAAAVVAARSSSTAWRNWFWRWASWGLEAQSRAASTMRAVASARVFAAARRRRCISESGCFSASPYNHHSMLHLFIFLFINGVIMGHYGKWPFIWPWKWRYC